MFPLETLDYQTISKLLLSLPQGPQDTAQQSIVLLQKFDLHSLTVHSNDYGFYSFHN